MLNMANESDLGSILGFCSGDLIGTRIACYCLSYGFNRDFFSVWISIFDGEIKGIVAKFYDNITVKVAEGCDIRELRDFCDMLSFNELVCDEHFSLNSGYAHAAVKKSYVFRGNADVESLSSIDESYYKQLYSLVSQNIPGSFEDSDEAYLSWLSDFTFRNRRGLSRSKGVVENGILLSSVITSSETENSAILSAVATSTQARGKGLGRKTVMSAVNELISENKEVYVIALNDSACGFYEHLGFVFAGNIHFIHY